MRSVTARKASSVEAKSRAFSPSASNGLAAFFDKLGVGGAEGLGEALQRGVGVLVVAAQLVDGVAVLLQHVRGDGELVGGVADVVGEGQGLARLASATVKAPTPAAAAIAGDAHAGERRAHDPGVLGGAAEARLQLAQASLDTLAEVDLDDFGLELAQARPGRLQAAVELGGVDPQLHPHCADHRVSRHWRLLTLGCGRAGAERSVGPPAHLRPDRFGRGGPRRLGGLADELVEAGHLAPLDMHGDDPPGVPGALPMAAARRVRVPLEHEHEVARGLSPEGVGIET
jgi:hypothetical protein